MRIVRSLILLLAGATPVVQAQVATDTSENSPSTTSSTPSSRLGRTAKQDVQVLGLRPSSRLRTHTVTDDETPAYVVGDTFDSDPDSKVTLTGGAQIRRIDTVLKGDTITYDRASGRIDAVGNARLMRQGGVATGPAMHYNVDDQSGQLDQPNFWLGAAGGFAKAEHADLFSRSTMRLDTVTYSGCECVEPSWYIKADTVDLDFAENEGVARDGVLYFKGVPILASTYLTFPIKKERKSGFLLPTYGVTSRSGIDVQVPYYFNLAPNYDATIYPRYLAKRGMQLGGEFRYLGNSYSGLLGGTYLPNDMQTGESRWMYTSRHFQSFGNGFYGSWNLNGVSDDNYFRDFSTLGLNEASTTYLPKQGMVGWGGKYWSSYVQVYKYQTLQDPDAAIAPPYDKLPELSLRGQRYDWGGFDAEFQGTATRFHRSALEGAVKRSFKGLEHVGPNGDRIQVYPTLSYPIVRPAWYITPKVGYNFTQYQSTSWYGNDWNNLGAGVHYPDSESRGLPIMSVDAGMTFERDTTLFGKDSVQTLEPRLFYLRVPYRDQSRMPVYDTTLADFSFAQAFEENIYTGGWDRIANANQLTAALTTRWLDANTGFERLSLSAGQQIYFQDQRVTLPNETPRSNVRSNFLVETSAALTDTLSTTLSGQYDPYNEEWQQGLVSARWSPQRLTSISLSYRYQRDPPFSTSTGTPQPYLPQGQNQVSLAFQWPFSKRWFGVGRVDYSLHTGKVLGSNGTYEPDGRRVTQAIAGVEYKGDCCWTGRVVFQRYAVATDDVNTAVFFQLELNGLGALGTDPLKLLSRSIPGYQNVNPTPVPGTTFERYE